MQHTNCPVSSWPFTLYMLSISALILASYKNIHCLFKQKGKEKIEKRAFVIMSTLCLHLLLS